MNVDAPFDDDANRRSEGSADQNSRAAATARPRAARRSARATAVDVVVHTHWDREWYMSRETTLARLVAVMSEVVAQLDNGTLGTFLFDGQTVAMRDLLSVALPALDTRLRAHAAAGRLVLGPWYVSADEFLVSGESLLRNLAFGIADAAAFGRPGESATGPHIGYLPDTFGHIAQMPQVLAQFGITQAVVWRGADAEHDRFDWMAPDGTTAGTVFLTQGYYLNPLHGPKWAAELPVLLDKLAARRAPGVGGPLLLPHGGDHLAPSPLIAERIAAFNAAQGRYALRPATLAEHASALLAAPGPRQVLHGELRHNRQAFVLPDVLSTRRHLKLAHQQLEDRLLGEIEPMAAVLLPLSPPWLQSGLDRAWRTLIEQQAHDSICGCSTDAVHDEMAQRLVAIGQQLNALHAAVSVEAAMTALFRHRAPSAAEVLDVFADDSRFTLFNPLPQRREGWFTVSLFLHGAAPAALHITAVDGSILPCEVLAVHEAAELISPLDDFPERMAGHRVELALRAALAGLGALALTATATASPDDGAAVVESSAIENAAWRIECLPDGRVALTDRLAGRRTEGVFELLCEADVGDSYSFSPPLPLHSPLSSRSSIWQYTSTRRGATLQELVLRAPGAELRLRLLADEPALQCELVWQHTAPDSRVRLVLPGCGSELTQTWSDTAFAFTARPVRLAQIPAAASQQEMPVVVLPSLSTIVAGPWALVHRAMHEHEIVAHGISGVSGVSSGSSSSGDLALAVTLVRGVGWLSRRDLRTRGVGAGPDIATPGAQCLGEHRFDFALLAQSPQAPPEQALQHAAALRRPPLVLRGHAPNAARGVDIGNPAVQTSSVRRLPDGRLELRLWNPSPLPQRLVLDSAVWPPVFADGRPMTHGAGPITLPPHGIVTLRERSAG